MEFIVFYLATILATSSIKFCYLLKVIKFLASSGYKLKDYQDFDRFKPIDLVLGVNIFRSLKNLIKPKLNEILISDQVISMDDDEKLLYGLEPNLLTALEINDGNNKRSEEDYLKLAAEKEIKINEENKIVYYINRLSDTHEFVILSTEGELLEPLTQEEASSIISEYNDYVKECIKNYTFEFYDGDETRFDDAVLSGELDFIEYKRQASKDFGEIIEKRLKR